MSLENKLEIHTGQWGELGVTQEFKKMVGENPDFISTVYRLIQEIPKEFNVRLDGNGVTLTIVHHTDRSIVYHARFEMHDFAIKIAQEDNDIGVVEVANGFKEIVATAEAKQLIEENEALKKLKIKIIPFQLGYKDSHHTFFVSTWKRNHWVMLCDLVISTGTESLEKNRILRRFLSAKDILSGQYDFSDVSTSNCFYDSRTDEIILYDLS